MRFSLLASFLASLILSTAAPAFSSEIAAQITDAQDSPAPLQLRKIDPVGMFNIAPKAWVNVINRTKHELITVDMAYSFYDAANAIFAQTLIRYTPAQPLASGNTATTSGTFNPEHAEPFNVTARVTCRVVAATFTGLKSWKFGQPWKEPLISGSSNQ